MALKCGIVGLPNVGKSTLFNSLTNAKAQAANFPFCTIEPNVGVITVPDERLVQLEKLVKPQKVVPTTIEIVDIAGLVKGASNNEGLGNKFLGNIRETDAIIHVLRCFDDDNITHVDGSVNPVRDKEIIDTELQLKDLETIESRIAKVKKIALTGKDKEAMRRYELMQKYYDVLMQGKPASTVALNSAEEEKIAKELFLLTSKPVLYLCNVDESAAAKGNAYVEQVREAIKNEDADLLVIAAATEADIAELETYEERQEFLEDLGLEESGLNKLIKAAYKLLNLQTYFTAGEKEVKAWTFTKGMLAPQTAGIIHSDFEKGFIRAEVIKYDDYLKYGSEQAVKEAGKMAVEGKEYVVQDGDIMHFRFNVWCMNAMFAIFIGGGLGSLARFYVAKFLTSNFTHINPLGTLVANMLAIIVLAFSIYWFHNKGMMQPTVKLLLVTGFCGGFSTFSTFSYETYELFRLNMPYYAIANALLSVSLGVFFMFIIAKWA